MSLVGIYIRVLQLLGKEARLGWILAAANLVLAATQFAEPVLFGRIVDVLSGKTGQATSAWPLLGAWAAFGLFTIAQLALWFPGGSRINDLAPYPVATLLMTAALAAAAVWRLIARQPAVPAPPLRRAA